MKKLFLSFVLLVSSACACLARSVQSEPIFAIYPEDSLTLKYYLGCEDKDCFVKFRLITRSTDVWEEGDKVTFICKDGTLQSIKCNKDLDDNGFHAVKVKTPAFAHMLTGITDIRLEHKKREFGMKLLPYTSSKTRNGVKQVNKCVLKIMADSINDIKKHRIDSLFYVENTIKYPNFTDFSYIKGCFQVRSWAKQEKKTLGKLINHDFNFAWDEYKKKK